MKTIICEECGIEFEIQTTKGRHKFCSRKCGIKNWNKNNRERVAIYRHKTSERRNARQRERYATDENYRLSAINDVKEYREKNPEIKKRKLVRKFGMTENDYFSYLDKINWKCEICENKLDGEKFTHVDHNHSTGKFRGILCANCNHGIGKFKDSIEFLGKAIIYLKEKDNG